VLIEEQNCARSSIGINYRAGSYRRNYRSPSVATQKDVWKPMPVGKKVILRIGACLVVFDGVAFVAHCVFYIRLDSWASMRVEGN
jgi:hypothetical protein